MDDKTKVLTPTVYIVHAICKKDDKYLVIQEKDGTWYLPAGRAENIETLLEGVIRETREEAGIGVEVTGLIGVYHSFLPWIQMARLHFIFEVKPVEEKPLTELVKTEADEHTLQSKWYRLDEINNLNLRALDMLTHIELYEKLQGKVLPIEAFQSEIKFSG